MLSLTPFRRVIKDYFLICESYFKAIRHAPPSQIEALDMGRRALHDEGSKLLQERLKGKIAIDHDTARREEGRLLDHGVVHVVFTQSLLDIDAGDAQEERVAVQVPIRRLRPRAHQAHLAAAQDTAATRFGVFRM